MSYFALGWFDLILNFAFDLPIFIALFIVMGALTCFLCWLCWLAARVSTILQNPPSMKLYQTLVLIVPPSIGGTAMALLPIYVLTSLGNMIINGYFFTDAQTPDIDPWGSESTSLMDPYNLAYKDMPVDGVPDITLAEVDAGEQENARAGRIGTVFCVVGFCCFNAGNGMYFPRKETKRERDLARRRVNIAEKDFLWTPTLWLKANFMFTSTFFAIFSVQLVELSFWGDFGDVVYVVIVMMEVFGYFFEGMLKHQLQDSLLVAPIIAGYTFFTQLVTFGSPDFVQFLLAYFVGFAIQVAQRIYIDDYLNLIFEFIQFIFNSSVRIFLFLIPKYFHKNRYIAMLDAGAL